MVVVSLVLFLGCGTLLSSGTEVFPIHQRPDPPDISWQESNDGHLFLTTEDYKKLRTWSIRMDSLVTIYEKQIKIINGK